MRNSIDAKEIKRVDPIWRHVWVGRIWKFLWLAYTVGYLIFFIAIRGWEHQGFYFLLLAFFNMAYAIILVTNEFRQEGYWRRIGERRFAALRDPAAFRARSQPIDTEFAFQLPVTIRLHWNRAFVLGILIFLLLMFCLPLLLIWGLSGGQHFSFQLAAIIAGVFAGVFLIALFIAYFSFLRYQPQSIELTEEGVTTRYLCQQRSLRWDEARIFAQYQRGVFNRHLSGITYELSNEQTVVRWSQQRLTATYLKMESNQNCKDDFNWLLTQVAAYVARRTNLPLLDFNDQAQPTVSGAEQADPLTPYLALRKEQLLIFGLVGIFAIALIIVSATGNVFPHMPGSLNGTSNVFTAMMLVGAIMMLLGVFWILWLFLVVRRYWLQINVRRTRSKLEPARYQLPQQPRAVSAPPQPGRLGLHVNGGFLFGVTSGMSFIVLLVLTEIILRQTGLYLLITVGIALFVALFSAVFTVALRGKRQQRRIEVSSNGITSRAGVLESQMGWQEARRFLRYRALRIFPGRAKTEIYELVGDNTVVRWNWQHNRLRFVYTDPKMSPDEYDRWMEQLIGYVIERTGLPLLDLDLPE
ncbi:hypothetical protein [Dictyobacter aurantiacus]|uniref:Uncharacterized protein n=1 Tax=Dictyobacter aurantiacus TaxID=1936993 RepID=A0A401ZNC2_9CHLR|nr:hypothetical protein [Dictyobacter aurantiacus]GCE08398.1 hypothetical protein KDAU_57270 [Dictyobacter aurantiacus]